MDSTLAKVRRRLFDPCNLIYLGRLHLEWQTAGPWG
jgi:hypothetical protein